MFKIEDNKIKLTRGDYAKILVNLTDGNSNPYTMQTGDYITLTVRERPDPESEILFSIQSLTNFIVINPSVTHDIEPGQYSYDIQVNCADGKVVTADTGKESFKKKNYKNFILLDDVTQ